MNRRIHAYYSGSVQGVGFRFTAENLALKLGLAGFVSNLREGRVEVVCEGAEDNIKKLLAGIDEHFNDYIRDRDIKWAEAKAEFDSFTIKF